MAADIPDFRALVSLDESGEGRFTARSPAYPWGRVYGGQVVAQALAAAAATVSSDHLPHSLHAYFVSGGDADEPIELTVDRLRDGRSFVTRQVCAEQSAGTIMTLVASFKVAEPQKDVQEAVMPVVPGPEELPVSDWGPLLARRDVPVDDARARTWLRVAGELGDDPLIQALALAYASDDIPTDAASRSHPLHFGFNDDMQAYDETFVGASLDHAIWFHRAGRNDRWVLHDFDSRGINDARGLSVGSLFGADGTHLATVAQEILVRERTR